MSNVVNEYESGNLAGTLEAISNEIAESAQGETPGDFTRKRIASLVMIAADLWEAHFAD